MSDASGLSAVVLQHEDATPGGLVLDWLEERGIRSEVVGTDLGEEVDLAEWDMAIPLGSEFPPYEDNIPWIPGEVELIREAHRSGVGILGVCFGGQMLARALGAATYRLSVSEIGWLKVRSSDPELVPDGPWFQWHFDAFEAPEGAEVLADSDISLQAFVIGQSMGLQFHPEVTTEIMEDWVKVYRHELDGDGVDPSALLEETYALAPQAAARAKVLFDGFLARLLAIRKSS